MTPPAAAIIVAAGAGTRFGSATPKQFLTLNGLPVYLHAVRAFRRTKLFAQVIVVVPPAHVARLARTAARERFTLVAGGTERHDSVKAGLAQLDDRIALVAIHDGARPLVAAETIAAGLAAARNAGASVVAVQARDTVKLEGRAGKVGRTVPRTTVWLAQTPQTFTRAVITAAYARRVAGITDDAQAVERTGRPVAIVPGRYDNIKITDRGDLATARTLLKERSA